MNVCNNWYDRLQKIRHLLDLQCSGGRKLVQQRARLRSRCFSDRRHVSLPAAQLSHLPSSSPDISTALSRRYCVPHVPPPPRKDGRGHLAAPDTCSGYKLDSYEFRHISNPLLELKWIPDSSIIIAFLAKTTVKEKTISKQTSFVNVYVVLFSGMKTNSTLKQLIFSLKIPSQ